MNADLVHRLAHALSSNRSAAIATLVEVRGSVPQVPGARLFVCDDGTCHGTVGGGAVEHHVLELLRARCGRSAPAERLVIDLTKDLGMCCGGSMVFLMENLEARERLVIFGAGHVAQPTASVAKTAGFSVVVIDDREEFNTEQRFPECDRILAEPKEAMSQFSTQERDYLLAITHDHRLDEEALRCYADQPHRYFGLIGSQRKVLKIFDRLRARGIEIDHRRVYAPVGIRLGAQTPEEIAISIVAELVSIRRNHEASHMRLPTQPTSAILS